MAFNNDGTKIIFNFFIFINNVKQLEKCCYGMNITPPPPPTPMVVNNIIDIFCEKLKHLENK
jgi:hypothetical protein